MMKLHSSPKSIPYRNPLKGIIGNTKLALFAALMTFSVNAQGKIHDTLTKGDLEMQKTYATKIVKILKKNQMYQPAKDAPKFLIEEKSVPNTQTEITGPEISQKFEGFTPRMKLDTESNTFVVGHGTDVGKLMGTWPYATYGQDVAELLRSEGMEDDSIRKVIHGETDITDDIAEKLFMMRYERRKKIIEEKYTEFSKKSFEKLPQVVQKMLVDFSYNMCGEYGIFAHEDRIGFPKACAALLREDWITFANEIADSNYAIQVGARRAGLWINALMELGDIDEKELSKEARELAVTYRTKHRNDIEGTRYVSRLSEEKNTTRKS